jgi:hypothetical protein
LWNVRPSRIVHTRPTSRIHIVYSYALFFVYAKLLIIFRHFRAFLHHIHQLSMKGQRAQAEFVRKREIEQQRVLQTESKFSMGNLESVQTAAFSFLL